ncbi:SDR family oxidoreductase [Plastoroseomonas arctica]|uniref:SDR family oxidoreductase n=1 Tax=Plastoroseomonas arctica TaxID=1509237 RepID=A0AAF1KHX4_9PROT|nr:SDR family oxidoreductase [Plastoroseomonas arctica]MBR0654434.1 SDR family oxidoreductase [Plastoroseomonas arctica]
MAQAMFDLTGRLALVTGSSQGIGFALARGLAQAGARVVLNGRDAAKLAAAAQRLTAEGLAVEQAAFDVTEIAALDDTVAAIEAAHGPLHILVNNAGIIRRMPSVDVTPALWREVLGTNVDAVFFLAQAAARRMIPRGEGKIINICSVQSELGRPTIAPYATSKGALRMMTRTLCAEWAKHGVQVNGIAPGYFDTELTSALVQDKVFTEWLCQRTPAGRWGRVEELVGAAVFLAAPASNFVNGQLLYVDGGMTAVV